MTENVDDQQTHDIAKGTRQVAGLTLVSRVLGFARDCIGFHVFGLGREMSAFAFAFMVPNLFRRLFGEGALSAAFIPVFVNAWEKKGPESAWGLFRRVLGALLAILGMVTGLLYLAVLAVAALLPEKLSGLLEISLLFCLLPYLPLVCLLAFFGAALQGRKHFVLPAMAPIITNVFWIAAALLAWRLTGVALSRRIYFLPAGILASVAFSIGLHAVLLSRRGAKLRPEIAMRDPGVRTVAANVAPVIVGLSILQFNVLVDGLIARILVSDVANAHLYSASRLFQFPLAMLGISIGTVVFPTLAQLRARHDVVAAGDVATRAVDTTFFLSAPAAVGLAVMARPIVQLLFEHGAFTPEKTAIVWPILVCYALALPWVCANQVLVRVFYSAGNTRTPVRVSLVAMIINLSLNLTLVWSMKEAGLALATALAGFVQFLSLLVLVSRRLQMLNPRELARSFAKTMALALVMGLAVIGALWACRAGFGETGFLPRTLNVAIPIATGGLAFGILATLFRCRQLRSPFPGRRRSS